MFEKPTVFILGAGASWHYGYPTGEKLVSQVIHKARELGKKLSEHANERTLYEGYLPQFIADKATGGQDRFYNAVRDAAEKCENLAKRLSQTNAPVIDHFLKWNSQLSDIGKLIISWILLECEEKYHKGVSNSGGNNWNENRRDLVHGPGGCKDDWCRFLLYKLVTDIDDDTSHYLHEKNNVTFVTFNYDLSLERALYSGLTAMNFLNRENIKKFFEDNRFIHVYGQIKEKHDFNFSPVAKDTSINGSWLYQMRPILDAAYKADIKAILDSKNDHEDTRLKYARERIEKAHDIYILGYGFDRENSKRLGLANTRAQRIFFTNFQDFNSINKRVNDLFKLDEMSADGVFYTGGKSDIWRIAVRYGQKRLVSPCYERSTRDVYEALEKDFDFL
jgi:hypothetical protein